MLHFKTLIHVCVTDLNGYQLSAIDPSDCYFSNPFAKQKGISLVQVQSSRGYLITDGLEESSLKSFPNGKF